MISQPTPVPDLGTSSSVQPLPGAEIAPQLLVAVEKNRPASDAERIAPLDVLRGFALLGILVMNIQAFSMIDAAYMNPTAYGDLTGGNFVVWLLCHVFADQKFMTIFSMLFGAGIVLMTSRAEARQGRSAGLHYRRMGVLLLFGMLHGYLLWYGDILYTYAMCGFVVYLLRHLQPRWLLIIGFCSLLIPSLISLAFGLSMPYWPAEAVEEFEREGWRPPPDSVAEQLEKYRGDWATEIVHRAPMTFVFQTMYLLIFTAWRAGGLMLVGMALFKLGVFSAERSLRFYAGLILLAILLGMPTILYGVQTNFASSWDTRWSFFLGSQFNYWGSILMSLGWVGVIMRLCKTHTAEWLTHRLGAVGQMALTNYFMHTLICTTIFYGRGFGQFGRVERVGQIAIVFAIWTVQLVISPLWLRRFQYGPAEWLWRTLTYFQRQPFLRSGRSLTA
jgi:uncharacterized protein